MKTEKQAHTPGPWTVGYMAKREYGGGVTFHETPIHVGEGESKGNALALVSLGGKGAIQSTCDAVMANAHLIAAAPDLLEALEEILAAENELDLAADVEANPAIIERMSRIEAAEKRLFASHDKARAAIAKATNNAEKK